MEEGRDCSANWPRYAVYTYSFLSLLAGGATIGIGVFIYLQPVQFRKLYRNQLEGDFDLYLFTCISAMAVGSCMILSSVTLAVCGVYKMNRTYIATYMMFLILEYLMIAAVGVTMVAHEPQVRQFYMTIFDYKDEATLTIFMRIVMVGTLSLAAFQMVGVMLTCCLQKAIEDAQSQK